jgi:hypothetical protein
MILSLFVRLISILEIVRPTSTQQILKVSWGLTGFLNFKFIEISNKILADKPAHWVGGVQFEM